jgi:Secretion system C-terminal sorting domain
MRQTTFFILFLMFIGQTLFAQTYCLSVSKVSETPSSLTVSFTISSASSSTYFGDATLVITGGGGISGTNIIANNPNPLVFGNGNISSGFVYPGAPLGTYTFSIVNHALPATFTINESGAFGVYVPAKISLDASCPTINTLSVLPIELKSFAATKDKRTSILDWKTLTEKNVDYFELLKSKDGRDFHHIGQLKAAGNSSVIQNYQFIDTNPNTGINYYQLKTVDYDGKTSLSEVKSLEFSESVTINNYPNPFTDQVHIDISTETKETTDGTLEIVNVLGAIVFQKKIENTENHILENLFLGYLPTGVYQLKIKYNGQTFLKKLNKV